MLVCYKPAGLATQTARVGQQDMVSELKNYLARTDRRAAEKKPPYLGVIHRLDQPVEGLLVFAKDSRTAAALSASLSQGSLNKQYLAVTCGQPEKEEAELVDYLAQEESQPAKKAILQYRVLKKWEVPLAMADGRGEQSAVQPLALLDIHIDTGRFHQIRIQMAHAGLPLLGDSRYGTEHSMDVSRRLGVRNVALCADRIVLKHPVTHKMMEFRVAPEGTIFKNILSAE